MPKSDKNTKRVLVEVRHGKRGYIVQALGSEEPYACATAEDVGEALIEILEDPDQPSMEVEAPEEQEVQAESESEDYEPEPQHAPPPPPENRPGNWTAGDELLMSAFGGLVDKLRKQSEWRRK
jgi:hypothetical protein